MKPGPSLAAQDLPSIVDIKSSPRDIEDWISDLALKKGWRKTRSDAQEAAEAWKDETLRKLRHLLTRYLELGRPPKFAFNSSSPYMIQGAAYIEGNEPNDVRASKESRARLDDYQEALASLTPRDFEFVCKGVLKLLQVDDAVVTQASADEGIDFYGRLRLQKYVFTEDVFPSIQHQLAVWLVGQAKHYKATQVATPDIRDLVGATVLARGHAFGSGGPDKYKELKLRPCDPVFILFITTGQISSDGWTLLERSGVVGMDGELVCAFLADRKVGVRNGIFDSAEFSVWLAELKS